jgi:hypothetical protein
MMATSQGNFKLQPGKVKCNIDASFHNDLVGISMCIRDEEGRYIRARIQIISPMILLKGENSWALTMLCSKLDLELYLVNV